MPPWWLSAQAFKECLDFKLKYAVKTLSTTERIYYYHIEWVISSELTLWKGCENLANEGHSQYREWPSLTRFSQPFHSVNSLLIVHSNRT